MSFEAVGLNVVLLLSLVVIVVALVKFWVNDSLLLVVVELPKLPLAEKIFASPVLKVYEFANVKLLPTVVVVPFVMEVPYP